MAKRVKTVIAGIVSLALLGFVVAVVIGLYTAMDSFGHIVQVDAATDTSMDATATEPAAEAGANSEFTASAHVPKTTAPDAESVIAEAANAIGGSGATPSNDSRPSSSTVPAGQLSSQQPSDSHSAADAPSSPTAVPSAKSTDTAPSGTPAASTPQRIYHPAWDEWVEEGHWETVETPAVMGQREVYGSVCNECGADISGQATAHLKATHHSGYHEGVVGYETYVISPATSERVWTDTSHWVHHEGYYD